MSKYPAAVLAIIISLLMPTVVLTSQGRFPALRDVPAINNPAQEASGWTAKVVEKRKPDMHPVTLRKIRAGRHASFDRVVFEFTGSAVPGYHIEYVDRPVRQCGSGDTVRVAGDGWLSVRLTPAQAHTDAGRPTISYRERRLRFPLLKELQSTCDFEGEVEWVLGVSSPNRYRVMELSNPARLVVDIKR
jgi:hypothetical protein